MHDGAIEAHSDGPGRGSEFVVRLPLAIDQRLGRSRESPAHVGEQGEHALSTVSERKRILVVDDNIDAAESLARVLRIQEHEVFVAHDGLAALAAANRLEPDVIFLDIGLPSWMGWRWPDGFGNG
jgi:PleD family two-component response regulator